MVLLVYCLLVVIVVTGRWTQSVYRPDPEHAAARGRCFDAAPHCDVWSCTCRTVRGIDPWSCTQSASPSTLSPFSNSSSAGLPSCLSGVCCLVHRLLSTVQQKKTGGNSLSDDQSCITTANIRYSTISLALYGRAQLRRRWCYHSVLQRHSIYPYVAHVFTALHGLHIADARSSDENSVCLSACPSVKRVICDKTEESSVQIFLYHTEDHLA